MLLFVFDDIYNAMEQIKSQIFNQSKDQLQFAFGGAAISGEAGGYGFGSISEEDSIRLLDEAFERGIRVFDSAPIYGFGDSEVRMGKAFRKKREKVYLVSKCGVDWHENRRVNMSNDPKICQKMLEQSLRRFQSDYIDLYMLHWPDSKVDVRHSLEVLFKAKDQGKIVEIGLCNTTLDDYQKARELGEISVLQGEWSALQRQNKEIRELAKKEAMAWMSWGPFDKGILTKRVNKDRKITDKADCRSWAPWWKAMDKESKYQIVSRIDQQLQETDFDLLDFSVAFQKIQGPRSLAIFGFRNSEQLAGVYDSFQKNFPKDLMKKIFENVFGEVFDEH